MGAELVMALQTLVSREISPLSPGVVTVGAFNSGLKHNIISDKAHLQLTVRSNDSAVRDQLIAGIKRIAAEVGRMNGMPEDRLPTVTVSEESDSADDQRCRARDPGRAPLSDVSLATFSIAICTNRDGR